MSPAPTARARPSPSCARSWRAAGHAVHVYTSPHLVRFHERIRLGRTAAGGSSTRTGWSQALRRCEAVNGGAADHLVRDHHRGGVPCSSPRQPADVLLLEVGLGGRLDATNVVEHPPPRSSPRSGATTPISSATRVGAIAAEKAGIFKRGLPGRDRAAGACRRRRGAARAGGGGRRPADPRRRPGFQRP